MAKIYYSVEEAEEKIKLVEKKVEQLMKLNNEINDITELQVTIRGDEVEEQLFALDLNRQFHKSSHELYEEMHALAKEGVVIKDMEIGLIDFYSRFEERDIQLCWKFGERGIRHWHEVDAGHKGRKPISILKYEYQEKLRKIR